MTKGDYDISDDDFRSASCQRIRDPAFRFRDDFTGGLGLADEDGVEIGKRAQRRRHHFIVRRGHSNLDGPGNEPMLEIVRFIVLETKLLEGETDIADTMLLVLSFLSGYGCR